MKFPTHLINKIKKLDFHFKEKCECCGHSTGIVYAKDTKWIKSDAKGEILDDNKEVAWWRDDTAHDHRFVLKLSEIEEVKEYRKKRDVYGSDKNKR